MYTLWDGLGDQNVRECVGHYVHKDPMFDTITCFY